MASWIDLYVEFARNNEAAEDLHWWTGITILGAALRRNVSFSKGYYKVYPATWTLVISPSGTKKTTAVQIGYDIVSKLEHVRILADKSSPEALAAHLGEVEEGSNRVESQGLIYAPELSNFMDKRQHNDGLVQLLLRLADAPDRWEYRTKSQGITFLRNIAVSFLGATANELLYDCIPPLALKSGFLARFVCITGGKRGAPVPFPWKDIQLENQVLNQLYELSLLRGDMVLPKKAQEWYIAWYFRHKARISRSTGAKLRAYYERKPDHLLRIGMLVSISKYKRLEYTTDSLEEAEERLDKVEIGLSQVYSEIDASPTGKDQIILLDMIKTAGGTMKHSDVIRQSFTNLDASTVKRLMQGLVEARLVKLEKTRDGSILYRRLQNGKMESRS